MSQEYVRGYEFPAAAVAAALASVGSGDSYRRSAAAVRGQSGRPTALPERRANGTLVADWVGVFAPVLWQRLGPEQWPDAVALDVLPLGPRRSGRPPGASGTSPWAVLAAHADPGDDGGGQVLMLAAAPRPDPEFLERFLRALPGHPRVVVAGRPHVWRQAIDRAWRRTERGGPPPGPALFWCERRLQHSMAGMLCRGGVPAGAAEFLADQALDSPAGLDHLRAEAYRWQARDLERWLLRHAAGVREQIRTRGPGERRTTGALPDVLARVSAMLSPRVAALGNLARTDLLLRLITLHLRQAGDATAYESVIRAAAGERTPARQRVGLRDPAGTPSLRRPGR